MGNEEGGVKTHIHTHFLFGIISCVGCSGCSRHQRYIGSSITKEVGPKGAPLYITLLALLLLEVPHLLLSFRSSGY